jgi:hypothetical protein
MLAKTLLDHLIELTDRAEGLAGGQRQLIAESVESSARGLGKRYAADGDGQRNLAHNIHHALLDLEQLEEVGTRHRQHQTAWQVPADIALERACVADRTVDHAVDFRNADPVLVRTGGEQLAEQLHAFFRSLHMLLYRGDGRSAQKLAEGDGHGAGFSESAGG